MISIDAINMVIFFLEQNSLIISTDFYEKYAIFNNPNKIYNKLIRTKFNVCLHYLFISFFFFEMLQSQPQLRLQIPNICKNSMEYICHHNRSKLNEKTKKTYSNSHLKLSRSASFFVTLFFYDHFYSSVFAFAM